MLNTKSLALIFILLLGIMVGLAALPPAFTAKGNPTLYKQLKPLAKENLSKLDSSHRRAYQKMLRDQDDVLMAYLIAYESDANLQMANPADVLSNYLQIRAYLNTYGTTLPPEFFLSYVAHQTVSDERIEAYREALLQDGLREILTNSESEMEIYRRVSQWCVGRLKFQSTSGRDQSPLDITQKSLLGRCEEMQILFVAAARTVGLPSRPASTPWWPHQDNNHAWAEVWLEGAWHYTGDMDAAYYPDQTWFSGMIDKTVLILADGSLPAEADEVLRQGRYESVINSIRNYAGERTRSLMIQTIDEQGLPLPDTPVGVMVYNWSSLRPLIWIKTDSEGKFTLSVGRGAFYLSAYKDGKQALELVPSGDISEIDCSLVLKSGPLADRDDMLFYPSNPFEWKQAPESWNEGVGREKARWNELDRFWDLRSSSHADSLEAAFLSAARGNYEQALEFLKRHPDIDEDFLSNAIPGENSSVDPKFFWQADAGQMDAVYQDWLQYLDEDLSFADLVSIAYPDVYYAELPRPLEFRDGSPSFYPCSFYQNGDTRLERLNKAARWLKRKYKIDADKALSGLLPLDIAIGQKYLSPQQYSSLAVSLALANGIPAAYAYRPNMILVGFDANHYGYYDLEKCAPETDPADKKAFTTLRVLSSDISGAPLTLDFTGNLNLIRYQDGSFYWSEGDPLVYEANGVYTIRAPKGEYYLNAGYRVSDSQTAFQMKHLDLSSADSLQVEMVLRDYPRGWSDGVYYKIPDLLAEVDSTGYSIFLFGNHDQENSIRLAEKLRGMGRKFLWLGHEPAPQTIADYVFCPGWQKWVEEDQRNRVRTITLIKDENGKWIGSYEGLWDRLPE